MGVSETISVELRNLVAARARVAQQDASVRNTTLTLNRMQALIKEQFVSQQDLDNAQVAYDAAVAALDSLRAQDVERDHRGQVMLDSKLLDQCCPLPALLLGDAALGCCG